MPEWHDPEDWITGERPSSAKMNAEVRDLLRHLHDWLGLLGYEESTVDSAGFTTIEETLITLNVTVPEGGRDVVLTAGLDLESTVAADEVEVRIIEGATVHMERRVRLDTANVRESFEFSAKVDAPASGANTYVLEAVRVVGTGTIINRAATESPTFLRAEAA